MATSSSSSLSRAVPGATRVRLLFGGAEAQASWFMVGGAGATVAVAVRSGGSALLLLIGAVFGVVGATLALARGARAIRLLRTGRIAQAALVRREVLRGSGVRGRVYRLTFAFPDHRGVRREVTADTADPERFAADLWPVVYDDADARVLALPPGEPRIAGGTVESGGWPVFAYLFIPVWAIAATLMIALSR